MVARVSLVREDLIWRSRRTSVEMHGGPALSSDEAE
jgi:hypothetical protein